MAYIGTIYPSTRPSDVAAPHQRTYTSTIQLKIEEGSSFLTYPSETVPPHRSQHTAPSRRGSQDVAHVKQRRGSHVANPYDIAQSPTRARFAHHETGAYPPPHHHIRHSTAATAPVAPPLSRRSSCTSASGDSPRPLVDGYGYDIARSMSAMSTSSSSSAGSSGDDARRTRRASDQPGIDGPMNHIRVPQGPLDGVIKSEPGERLHKPIQFVVRGIPEPGVRIREVTQRGVDLEGARQIVLKDLVEKSIYFWINWPGYPPLKKRVSLKNKTLTRIELITSLCTGFDEWAKSAAAGPPSDPRFPDFVLRKRVDLSRIFITELVHVSAANWRLELWVPQQSY